jgi:hypothetical protein
MNRTLLALLVSLATSYLASAADYATEVMEATFKLYHPDSTATCFLVRREAPDNALYLVTASHVFEGTKGDTAIVVLREAKQDGSFERRDHTITVRRDGKPLWLKHATEDVAVLRLAEPLPVPVVPLPFSEIADGVHLSAAL